MNEFEGIWMRAAYVVSDNTKLHYALAREHDGEITYSALCGGGSRIDLDPDKTVHLYNKRCVPCVQQLPRHLASQKTEVKLVIQNRAEVLMRQATALMEEAARIEALPDFSKMENDTVLYIKKTFSDRPGDAWTYAAIKVQGRWYMSGSSHANNRLSDAELLQWLTKTGQILEISRVTAWEQMV